MSALQALLSFVVVSTLVPLDRSVPLYRRQLHLRPCPIGLHRIRLIRITLLNQIDCLRFVFSLLLFGWLWLQSVPLVTSPVTVVGFFNCPEIELFIKFGYLDFLIFSTFIFSTPPPQVRHVEVQQTKRTRKLPQLVQTQIFGEDINILAIYRKIHKVDLELVAYYSCVLVFGMRLLYIIHSRGKWVGEPSKSKRYA